MTVDQLCDLKDAQTYFLLDKKRIDLLLQAINDWPSRIDTIDHYFAEVRKFLGIDSLNYSSVMSKMELIDPESYLWHLESLSSLSELLSTDQDDNNVEAVMSNIIGISDK
jgi:hypothetical protein